MESFSLEDKIKKAVVPLPGERFLDGLIAKEDDLELKIEEQGLKDQLEKQKMYEELFAAKDKIESVPVKSKQNYKIILPKPGSSGWESGWLRYLSKSYGGYIPKNLENYLDLYRKNGFKKPPGVFIPQSLMQYATLVHRRIHGSGGRHRNRLEGIQYSKDSIMGELKSRLQGTDISADYPEAERFGRTAIFFDDANGEIYFNNNGFKKYMSEDDIVADLDWRIKYRPDISMPKKIWRRIRKLSDINEAKNLIQSLYSTELVLRGYGSGSAVQPQDDVEFSRPRSAGFLAEKMIVNILKRRRSDYKEGLIIAEPSDSIEDSEFKYDFKVQFIPWEKLGVGRPHTVGFQLTVSPRGGHKGSDVTKANKRLSTSPDTIKIKNPVERVVLLRSPRIDWTQYYTRWLNEGKPSGGPEQYLTDSEKESVISSIMKEFSVASLGDNLTYYS
ncbi:MAG: hypothetical protein HY225_02725 [Candidatus Vogelbacteria bacterium]|nr:hypothetical protein [Candidatus Vogelbacteria bacterium]